MPPLRIDHPAYGPTNVGPLEQALCEAIADKLEGATREQVAETLIGLYAFPSDTFYAAWDHEIATLTELYREVVAS